MNTIITGATKGIGRALALKFASQGHSLAICSRNSTDLQQLKNEIFDLYKTEVYIESVDISNKEQVIQFAINVAQQYDTIDVLINNAGIFIPGTILNEQDGTLERMMDTNLYSAYYLTKAVYPLMQQSLKPHIFNMCSIASFMAYPNGGSYAISKFALLGLTKVLRAELKTEGIRVTAIMPGATWTDSWAGADFPEDRLMDADDIAETIWTAYQLNRKSVVEEIIIRPQLGDL